ncbi:MULTISPECIES: DUF1365 domain-containing protein [unclassified Janthinobacterium]|uniref:DUF1365 domain-containing protein n=1 Tax=unclassified Janthinobacterium TaxID=2610881 RepID=UPI001614EB64|nr:MULTISPECIES: DUF1365 domain-containing protein [unclassified Janthinobacterium]MBB5370562.1 hypothetical protein [Janthinobacterium sp. K2C7]MBB5383224.1 hypothetical protein [Janthinobacterium sp. K2Li3]MBB5388678.1 hypothetical protein [Janthinobacterium sp. K2E3]
MPRDSSLPAMAQPQLCLGQVRHTRLRPRRHFFSYGIYYLRLPLRSMGGQDFSARLISRNGANVLSFRDSDHGDGVTPLLDWIDGLLHEQGVSDADGEIWLQTMPRVFGYVFNPVSFWFCHRADGALRAVLCDVRNTFGERHLYLLDHGAAIAYGSELRANKIFHVSPFCKVEGGYRFRFLRSKDDAGQGERHLACVDYDDTSGPLLQTSLSGIAVPLRDRALGRALLRYPLMTFGVMARIHWQALRLWLRRVPFFSKPHPPQEKLSR